MGVRGRLTLEAQKALASLSGLVVVSLLTPRATAARTALACQGCRAPGPRVRCWRRSPAESVEYIGKARPGAQE